MLKPVKFLAEFLRNPRSTGAIAPSSGRLANAMVDWFDWSEARTVIEYGPGTGAFTGTILANLDPATKFLAIEFNERFADALVERFPAVNVCRDSVANVRRICDQHGLSSVDTIICGLPWAAFSNEDQTCFLDAMMSVLPTGGRFATFAYLQGLLLPAGRRFRKKLDTYFSSVQRSPVIYANLPPAIVYRCIR